MVRKKNKMFVDSADRTPHYSLRKLSVGVASVLLSTTLWMGANGSVAHADPINDTTVAGKVEDKTHKDQTQAQVSAPASAEERASTTEQTAGQASAPAGGDNQNQAIGEGQDQISDKNRELSSLADRAEHQDELTVKKEGDKTYTIKQKAVEDLDKQTADIQSKVTKYEADKAAYDAAKKVYDDDPQRSTDQHMVTGISQGLSFANEHDASLAVTSGSDKKVKFIKCSAWHNGDGVYTDGIYNGGNISKSFSDPDISYNQAEGTASDDKQWGINYTGVQLTVGESVVARYTGLKNSVYIDKDGVAHKLGQAQVKYTLNDTTAKDRTANIFLSNNPNIALWYGAAGDGVTGGQKSSGRVDLTVDLTFYDENGKPITLDKGSDAWLDMSSLNNGTTKVEYFAPNDNTTMQIPGSSIKSHADGRWYADNNNEVQPPAPAGWDNPKSSSFSANRYYGAAIMELEGHSFHIGQEITKYNPGLTNSRNVYSWFALDSSLATAYKPVKPTIVWHGVTYEPQKATVTYHDDTANTDLKTDSLEGDSNSVASNKDGTPYTTESSINSYKSQGYELVSDSTGGKQLTFDSDSSVDQHFVVHLKHGIVTVTLAKDAKQTIHYEGAGTDTPADNVTTQKHAFTRTVTYDKVTGKSTTSEWSKTKTTFDKVDNPVVKGYTTKNKQAGGLTATPEHPEVTDTVVYTPNGSIVPVDPNGNPIPNTPSVPYETDPKDPTKVVDGKVPEVPGWTPKNGKPGDSVKPSDPTKDTEVPYDHTMTPGETTVPGKVEGLPEKPAKSAKAPAEKLVKTPVKAPKAVKEAAPAEMPAQKAAQAQDQLPQTGEDNSKAAFGLGLASILGGIGILGAFKRKKKEN
ncbi:GbpC/Spa domain-containing protein [Lactobacillus amylovorus]|uniref:GbpC/Spa domain-containing protein n=1 Tax=Lactobacillus amylovorus TaxID=1604 RepID=UPI003F8A7A8B